MKPFLFISYSHSTEDRKAVKAFVKRLDEAGIAYFLDDLSIRYGDSIPDTVEQALKKASHVVAFLSPASEASQWVFFEMGIAYAHKKIVVLRLLHSRMHIPPFLARARYMANSREESKFIDQIKRSTHVMYGWIEKKDPDLRWGFVKPEAGDSLFFRSSDLVPPLRLSDLGIGEEVEFEEGRAGLRSRFARNVRAANRAWSSG